VSYLPRLALNRNPSDVSLPNRYEHQLSALGSKFLINLKLF
jgi:hypothetical protein